MKIFKWGAVSISSALLTLMVLPFSWLKLFFDGLSTDNDLSFLTPSTAIVFRVLFCVLALIVLAWINYEINWVRIYAIIVAFLYSAIGSAQVFGYLKIYRIELVLPFVLCLTPVVYFFYTKYWFKDFHKIIFRRASDLHLTEYILLGFGMFILVFVILVPLIIWPYSAVNPILAWDVGLYHFPKAIELANTASIWDLSIPYGEYPFGYESLFSFAVLLTKSGILFGSMHALGVLFFVLTFWFLLCRYTNLPVGFSFLVVICLLVSGLVWRDKSLNIWWIYRLVFYDAIGKNDLFLAASILAVILHAPVSAKPKEYSWYPLGMAMTTMIALSVKPNAVFVVVPAWGYAIYLYLQSSARENIILKIKNLAGYFILILPGLLWILRNVIAQDMIFSSAALKLQDQSILNNLMNPNLFSNIPFAMIATLGVLIWSFCMAIYRKRSIWAFSIVFLILFISFIATPASGFVHPADVKPYFSWRFGIALLTFLFIAIVVEFEPWLVKIYKQMFSSPKTNLIFLSIIGCLALLIVWERRSYFLPTLSNLNVLEDQYSESVGVDGYNSPFDYLHKNVRNSVVRIENGLPFYLYGPEFTNSISLLKPADYIVILRTAWQKGKEENYPPKLETASWNDEWSILYEDNEGRVYQHK